MVKVLYFGRIREKLGISEDNYEYIGSLAGFLDILITKHEIISKIITDILSKNSDVGLALNLEYLTSLDIQLINSDELAFIPPISGG